MQPHRPSQPRSPLRATPSSVNQDFAVCPTASPTCHTASVPRDLEDRIQQLCARIAATDNDEELYQLCVELQQALNEHVGFLRRLVADFRGHSKKHPPKKGD